MGYLTYTFFFALQLLPNIADEVLLEAKFPIFLLFWGI